MKIQAFYRGYCARKNYLWQIKKRKMTKAFMYFDEMRTKLLTEAQLVIKRYWCLYKNNKNYFK